MYRNRSRPGVFAFGSGRIGDRVVVTMRLLLGRPQFAGQAHCGQPCIDDWIVSARYDVSRPFSSARNGAIVSVPTATPPLARNSRMSRSETPFCRSSTMPF